MPNDQPKSIRKDVGFPVYALAWQNESIIFAAGGGGTGKFGVKNKIVIVSAGFLGQPRFLSNWMPQSHLIQKALWSSEV
jgi:hypothetical protein